MFQLRADYAIHEGGTKYYQVFSITDEHSGNCCVVTHWGAYKAGAARAPKHHGKAIKVDVYRRAVASGRANGIIRAKSGRGYSNWERYVSSEKDSDAFATILEGWFKQGDVELIMSHLLGMDEPEEDVTDLDGIWDDDQDERNRLIQQREEKKRVADEAAKELSRKKLLEDERFGAW